ncbi:MAG: cell division protein FtsH, partial [Deltaproteobacteria bacterium]|nr:cell division protein FtsH [Deltaproteobacteria bacterium]
LVLNRQTTGAGNDIERSTELARKMVCEWGMSEKLGPMAFGQREEQIFLGREITQHRDYSEETAQLIDSEIRAIVTRSYEKAKEIIQGNMETLHRLANTLLEKEVLDGNQIDRIIKGEEV